MFLWEYLKHPKSVGALAPSSRFLAKRMVAPIDFHKCKCIVEYGPGTGVFTQEIVKRKKKETVFIVIEKNDEFYKNLQQKYRGKANIYIVHGDAADIGKYLKKYNCQVVDYVISGLPFTSLPKEVTSRIFKATKKVIGDTGVFITFQYTLLKKKVFMKWFRVKNIRFELINFPSAFVLEMENK